MAGVWPSGTSARKRPTCVNVGMRVEDLLGAWEGGNQREGGEVVNCAEGGKETCESAVVKRNDGKSVGCACDVV